MATDVFYRLQVFITVVCHVCMYLQLEVILHRISVTRHWQAYPIPMSMNEFLVVCFHKHAIVTHQRIHC